MDYLARHVELRLDPRQLLPGARSVICVADRLPPPPEKGGEGEGEAGGGRRGRVARYVHISDYHKVLKKRLIRLADALRQRRPEGEYRVCVDTAPLLEREHAMRAGLGWIGKHTLLLSRDLGSHLLLGAIVTTLDLAADARETDHCGTCRRCIEACPTQCITPYSVDATRCISYLTIEHRSAIDPQLHEPMGAWLFGCDICQDVCPYVRKAERERPAAMPAGYERKFGSLDLLEVLEWSEADRRAAFVKSAMKRAKLDMLKRNALIVAGNRLAEADDPALRERIERSAADPDEPELVRRTARAVRDQLAGKTAKMDEKVRNPPHAGEKR
jgi:epoxyqueuosine reductase